MADVEVIEGAGAVRVVATVDGQVAFDFDFLAYTAETVQVTFEPQDGGPKVPLTLNVDYSVAGLGVENGGTITLIGAFVGVVVEDDALLLYRRTPVARTFDYQTGGDFRAVTVNRELDTVFMIAQELRRDVDLATKVPYGVRPVAITPGAEGTIALFDDNGDLIPGLRLVDVSEAAASTAADRAYVAEFAASFGSVEAAIEATETLRDEAAAIGEQTADDRDQTGLDVVATNASKVAAETAADAAQLAAGVFASTALGLAGTSSGEYFSVPSAGADDYVNLYRHDAGPAATFIKAYPSTAAVDTLAFNDLRQGSRIMAVNEGYRAPLEITVDGYVLSERLAQTAGDPFPKVIEIVTGDGQSNSEGQSSNEASIEFTTTEYKNRPRMPRTAANNIWLGITTSGGVSTQLASNAITGLMGILDTFVSDDYGTTELSSAVRKYTDKVRELSARTPDVIGWVNAEGGQTIANMLNNAPAGNYYFANAVSALTQLLAFLDAPAAWTWSLMNQGESDSADALLGSKHNLFRSQIEAVAVSLLKQTERLRMASCQPSSFFTNSAGARSILAEALADVLGVFFCTGPTYAYPWAAADYLHHTGEGHAMSGHMHAWVMETVKRTGQWKPLYVESATRTGANQVTAVLSEAAVIDAAWLVSNTGLANSGVGLVGTTVSSVAVSGRNLVIGTSGAASLATAVQIAMVGHSGARAVTTIPRSTIRSVAQWDDFPNGAACHKPICHQEIAIS